MKSPEVGLKPLIGEEGSVQVAANRQRLKKVVSMSPSSGSGWIGPVAAVAMSAEVADCGDGAARAATLR